MVHASPPQPSHPLPEPPIPAVPAQSYGEHSRAMLVLGLPLIGSNLAQFAIHLTDTIMLGWYDVTALAAATLATSLYFVIFILGAGFAWAVMPMVAAAAESGDEAQVRRVTRMGIWLSVIYGFITTTPLMWTEAILLAIGQDPDVSALAQDYLRIAAWALIPALIVMVLRSFLSALEHTAIVLYATVTTTLLNIVLNYALIFGNWGAPELGIRGAAVASLVLVVISVVVLVFYILRRLPAYNMFQRIWKIDTGAFVRVFRLGWPIGITSLAEGGLFSASAVMMGWIGAIPLAAHGIAIQLASAMFMVHIGLSQAATVRAGRALGRRDEPNLRRGGKTAIAMSLCFGLFTVAVFLLIPEPLIRIFLDPEDPALPQIIPLGILMLALAALFQLADAAQVMVLGLLRGVQDTTVPMIMAAFSYWVIGMPASYLLAFPLGMGPAGLWIGLVIGLSVAAGLMLWRFWGRSVRIT